MPFKDMLNDRVRVMHSSGEEHADISASVQKNKIFIQQSDILIEAGDFIERKMSNGGIELYEIIDPGFHEALGSIPAGYQMVVKKSETLPWGGSMFVHLREALNNCKTNNSTTC